MSANSVLVDTHALLWWQAESPRLSRRAWAAIEAADQVLVRPIALWEVSMLCTKQRVQLDRPVEAWVNDLLALAARPAALSPRIVVLAGSLDDFHGDPADRIIYATAAVEQLTLISKDQRMIDYAADRDAAGSSAVQVVW